jgi:hypothetical protein
LSIESLSDVPLYAARPSRQVPAQRKATAWLTVLIVHLLLLNLFIFSQIVPVMVRHGDPKELMLDLRGITRTIRPNEQIVVPEAPMGKPPEVVTEPIVIPPPVVQVQPEEQRPGAPEGDLLGALGREVACSAGNYETLTQAQRSRCPRMPWQGARLPNGAVVLQTPPPRNRFFDEENARQAAVEAARISGADGLRNRIEGANDGCPVILNTPCFNRIPGRN